MQPAKSLQPLSWAHSMSSCLCPCPCRGMGPVTVSLHTLLPGDFANKQAKKHNAVGVFLPLHWKRDGVYGEKWCQFASCSVIYWLFALHHCKWPVLISSELQLACNQTDSLAVCFFSWWLWLSHLESINAPWYSDVPALFAAWHRTAAW